MKYLLHYAFKNQLRHLTLSFLTILGIALGVALILAVSIINSAIKTSVLKVAREMGTGNTDIWLAEKTENYQTSGVRPEGFNQVILDDIQQLDEVQSVHPSLKLMVITENNGISKEVIIYGIDFKKDTSVRNHLFTEGRMPVDREEIILGKNLAQELIASIGSNVVLKTPNHDLQLKVSGFLKDNEGSGLLHNNKVIFCQLSLLQKYFDYQKRINAADIILKKGEKAEIVIKNIRSMLPYNIDVSYDPLFISISHQQTAKLRIAFFSFSFIALFIAIFIIYNTFSSSLVQYRREIGLLRLIGMKKRQVFFTFVWQSLYLALFGVFLGLFLGIALAALLLYLVSLSMPLQTFFFQLPNLGQIIYAVTAGIIATFISGTFPCLKAARLSPLDCLKENSGNINTRKKGFSMLNCLGFLLFGVGLILEIIFIFLFPFSFGHSVVVPFLLFGFLLVLDIILPWMIRIVALFFKKIFKIPGILAAKSLYMHLRRTTITIGAISITIAIIIAYLGMTQSLKTTINNWVQKTGWADLIIYSTSGAEMKTEINRKLEQYPFVKKINAMRYVFVSYRHEELSDNGFLLQGLEPLVFNDFFKIKILEGDTERTMQQLANNKDTIILNSNLAKKLDLEKGDMIELQTMKGLKSFQIIGTLNDFTDFMHRMGKVAYCSRKTILDYWQAEGNTVIQLKLSSGISLANATQIIRQDMGRLFDIKLITHEQEKREVSQSIDNIFAIFYLINVVLYLIVFMALFQTVLLNVLFQIYELTMIRVLGLSKKGIKFMVLCQAIAMAVIGLFFATILGFLLGFVFTQNSTLFLGDITYSLPIGIAIFILIITIPITWLATFYPQKIACRESISSVLERIAIN